MPQEYVYSVSITDENVENVLKGIDDRITSLGQSTQKAFSQIEQKMGQGAQKGARKASQAMTKQERSAQKLEQRLTKLFSAELKLAAGADEAAQEILKQASAGAKNADALAQSVGLTGVLSDEQINYARSIAETKARITELSAALSDEEADHQAVTAALAQEQQRLVAINEAREQAAARAQAEAEAQRLVAEGRELSRQAREKEIASQKRLEQQHKRVAAQVTRNIKTFPRERAEIAKLVQQHGSFTAVLNSTEQELSEVQREFLRIIQSNPKLQAELKKTVGEFRNLELAVDRPTFVGAGRGGVAGISPDDIRKTGFALERFGIQGAGAFGEIIAVAGTAGIAIGGVLATVQVLQKAFSRLARVGVRALKDLIRQSVEAARSLDTTRAIFTAIFEGDAEVGEAVLERLLELSTELGQDVTEIGRAFLADVGSIDQAERLVRIATALARAEPEQGISGARISLQELIQEGQVRSLVKRFESIGRQAARAVTEAMERGDMDAALRILEERLRETGRSVEDLSDTFDVRLGQAEQAVQRLEEILGEPIIEDLQGELEDLMGLLDRMEPELQSLARGIGEIVGEVAGLAGDDLEEFLESLDPQRLQAIADNLGRIAKSGIGAVGDATDRLDVDKLVELTDTLADIASIWRELNQFSRSLQEAVDNLLIAQEPLEFLAEMTGIDVFDELSVSLSDFAEGLRGDIELLGRFNAFMSGMFAANRSGIESLKKLATGEITFEEANLRQQTAFQEAYNESIAQTTEIIEEEEGALESAAERQEDFGEATEESTDAALDQADAMLQLRDAQDRAASAAERLAEAQETIREETAETQREINQRRADIQTDRTRELRDLEIELSRKRGENAEGLLDALGSIRSALEQMPDTNIGFDVSGPLGDIGQKLVDNLHDMFTKFRNKERDAWTDWQRDLADIDLKGQRRRIEIEESAAQDRVDLERDFQRELAEIKRKADDQAFEAALQNDALEIRRIRRQEEREIREARIKRDEKEQDIETSAQREREKLQRTLDQEREDAKIARQRKLADLRQHLNDQYDMLITEARREQRDLEVWEERKREDIDQKYADRVNDFLDFAREKIAELRRTTEDERQAIVEEQGKIIAAEGDIIEARLAMWFNFYQQRAQYAGMFTSGSPYGGPYDMGGSAASPGPTIGELRKAARQAARNALVPPELWETLSAINDMNRDELKDLITSLGGVIPRFMGGPVAPGVSYLVGEEGPEIFRSNVPGEIVPMKQLTYAPPPPQTGGQTMIDRSVNMGGLEVPYRAGLSPVERSEVEIIAANIVRRAVAR